MPMPEMEQLIVFGVYALIGLFVLVQLFLALRPGFIWGLLMPLMFALFWLAMVMQPAFLPFEFNLNATAIGLYDRIGLLGALFSLLIFALCRLGKLLRRKSRERRRLARVEEKQRRRQQANSVLAADQPPGQEQP